jgi:hypothetical protein
VCLFKIVAGTSSNIAVYKMGHVFGTG